MNSFTKPIFLSLLLLCISFLPKKETYMYHKKASKEVIVNGVPFYFKFIKGGIYDMGFDSLNDLKTLPAWMKEASPRHSVQLTEYYLLETEVSVKQYLIFCKETNSSWPEWMNTKGDFLDESGFYRNLGYTPKVDSTMEKLPVLGISWIDAHYFCNWLSEKSGLNIHMPTEAQWEYAAREGKKKSKYKYSGSNSIDEVAVFRDTTKSPSPLPVGSKKPNKLGIYDMSGNIWELCEDVYRAYADTLQINPYFDQGQGEFIVRGGSWNDDAEGCALYVRGKVDPVTKYSMIGFRLVISDLQTIKYRP